MARWVKELDLPLTLNAPIHRQNIEHLPQIIDYAVELGAGRLEVAHIQYYAWALRNRASLMPTREQFMKTVDIVEALYRKIRFEKYARNTLTSIEDIEAEIRRSTQRGV